VPGRVLIIRTSIPGERSFLYLIGVADGKVRLGSESDQWRLIDVTNRTVTFVDETARTYRTATGTALVQQNRAALRGQLPPWVPPARFEPLRRTRSFGGFPAAGYRVTMGGYERELWLSYRSIIAPEFLELYLASEPLSEPYGAAMREVFDELLLLQGFPVHERSAMPVGEKAMVIERTLLRVVDREVPAIWFEIPGGFRNLTPPPTTPSAGRPAASSVPRGRTAPAAE
jgi:hypothetical protein